MSKQSLTTAPSRPVKSAVNRTSGDGRIASLPSVTAPAPAAPSPNYASQPIAEEDIRTLAYLKWEAAGKPEGKDAFFWVEAERELARGRSGERSRTEGL